MNREVMSEAECLATFHYYCAKAASKDDWWQTVFNAVRQDYPARLASVSERIER